MRRIFWEEYHTITIFEVTFDLLFSVFDRPPHCHPDTLTVDTFYILIIFLSVFLHWRLLKKKYWKDLRQNVVLASVLVIRRHKSIAVICIEMFGNPGNGNNDIFSPILVKNCSN